METEDFGLDLAIEQFWSFEFVMKGENGCLYTRLLSNTQDWAAKFYLTKKCVCESLSKISSNFASF